MKNIILYSNYSGVEPEHVLAEGETEEQMVLNFLEKSYKVGMGYVFSSDSKEFKILNDLCEGNINKQEAIKNLNIKTFERFKKVLIEIDSSYSLSIQ